MPIQIGNDTNTIPRVKVGNETIKRVYRGNELLYGLYDVHYYDRSNIDNYDNIGNVYDSKLQKEYAWGYVPECKTIVLPNESYRNEYNLNGYPTHFGDSNAINGWYKDSDLNQQKNKIDLNDQQDFDFYARWRQHKYAYDGIIEYDHWVWVEPPGPGPGPEPPGPPTPGSWDLLQSPPTSYDWPYSECWGDHRSRPYGGPDSKAYGLQCTWYCYNRSGQVTNYFMPNGRPPGSVESGYFTSGKTWRTDGGIKAGNIIVTTHSWFPSDGHVMFIESVNGDIVTVSDTFVSYYIGTYEDWGAPWTINISELYKDNVLYYGGASMTILGFSNNPNT